MHFASWDLRSGVKCKRGKNDKKDVVPYSGSGRVAAERKATWQQQHQHQQQTKAEPDAVERSLIKAGVGRAKNKTERGDRRGREGGGTKLAATGTRGTKGGEPQERRGACQPQQQQQGLQFKLARQPGWLP